MSYVFQKLWPTPVRHTFFQSVFSKVYPAYASSKLCEFIWVGIGWKRRGKVGSPLLAAQSQKADSDLIIIHLKSSQKKSQNIMFLGSNNLPNTTQSKPNILSRIIENIIFVDRNKRHPFNRLYLKYHQKWMKIKHYLIWIEKPFQQVSIKKQSNIIW